MCIYVLLVKLQKGTNISIIRNVFTFLFEYDMHIIVHLRHAGRIRSLALSLASLVILLILLALQP